MSFNLIADSDHSTMGKGYFVWNFDSKAYCGLMRHADHVRESQTSAIGCPTCKADFETVFKDGLLQVVWVKAKPTKNDSAAPMTDALARDILGLAPGADFAAIKAAWRKASQQYHPDMHQGLPERLRKAAETEMQRINEAYRFLEGSTATDF